MQSQQARPNGAGRRFLLVGRWLRQLADLMLALICAGSPGAFAAAFYSEDLRIPMAEAGSRGLEAFLMRPAASGKYPLALISHGSPRDTGDRPGMAARKYRAIAAEFAGRGFAALVVLRRGYGTSPGGRVDSYGSCGRPDYSGALAVAVADLQAAIAAMKSRSDVTTQGMIAIGHSAGGLATMGLAAQAPPGLVAAINFAGGRGSRSEGKVCGAGALLDVFRKLGTTSRVPMLWVYANNDKFFAPDLAHRFRNAFMAGGGNVTFIDAPAFGSDGHYLFSTGSVAAWTPYVDNFLSAQNLPHAAASIAALLPPRQLGENGQQAFAQFMDHAPHKAFAVAPDGSFGWRSRMPTVDDATREALEACSRHATGCRIYSVDGALAR
jgi:dienelactone hydrolase